MLHLDHALQALGDLMEAALAAIQLQNGQFAGLVEEILADDPASVIGDVAAALFGLLAFLQAEVKFRFVARTTGSSQVVCGTRQSAGRAARWILSKTTASSTQPVLVSLEFYENSSDSIFNIVAYSVVTLCHERCLPFNVEFTQDQKSTWEKKDSNVREDSRERRKKK